MSTVKRCISLLLTVCLIMGLLSTSVLSVGFSIQNDEERATVARDEPGFQVLAASGTCGDNLTWTLDDDGVLTISGTGEMSNYSYFFGMPMGVPWYSNRYGISSVVIENGVTSVGNYAFYSIPSLRSVTIGSSVNYMGDSAFQECNGLNEVHISDLDAWCRIQYTTLQSNPLYYADNLFLNGELVSEVTYPADTEVVYGAGFANCKSLEKVTIPEGTKVIGSYAFFGCEKLVDISIPDSVTKIHYEAFKNCISLSTVDLPDSLTAIASNLFYSCSNLQYLTLPSGVTEIGDGAFYSCTNLQEIVFHGNAPSIGNNAFYGVSASAYYPAGDVTWTEDVMQDYGGQITWYSQAVISTSIRSRSAEDLLLLYPLELNSLWTFNTTLSDVTISSSLGEITHEKGSYMMTHAEAMTQDIILSKDGYRDYVLPAAVSETLVSAEHPAYDLSAYMQKDTKDGKPYISTVFGRVHGSDDPYTDLRVTELVALEDESQDIIITACGFSDQDVTYYLAQDSNHKVSSTTGIFENRSLYGWLDDVSTVYAYAVGSDGTTTTPLEIKLRRADYDETLPEFLMDSEFSLLGKDFLKISISEDIPLLGGTEIDLSAFTFPMGVEVEGDEIKVSLGLDLFSSTENEDGYKWKSFKDMVITDSAKIESDFKAIESFCKEYKLNKGKSWKTTDKANKFNINVLGYVEAKWVNGELIVKEGMISLGGKLTFEYVAQGAVWVIPVYGSVEAGTEVRVSGKATRYLPDSMIPFNFNIVLDVEPEVTGGAGAGVKGAVSGGLYAKGTLPTMVEFQDEHMKMELKGELGIEGEFFIFEGKKPILEGDTNLIDWYYGTTPTNAANSEVRDASATVSSVFSRDYAESTSRWLGDIDQDSLISPHSANTASIAARGVTFKKLQTSIFVNSQPQLVTYGDQMLLVWVEDDPDRDSYNRMRLVFSVFDLLSDSWSEPAPVWDDGHNDGYPRMVSDGENVWVVWQKVNVTLTETNTSTIDTALENSELCLSRFDAQLGVFTDHQVLTSNTLYEYSHNVILTSGSPVVYWAAATENAISDSGCHTLYRWENGVSEVLEQGLNHILSIDALDDEITYIMDTDGVLSDLADVTAFTVSNSVTSTFDNSEMGAAVTYAGYAPLNGESTLFFSNMENIYYHKNGELMTVLSADRPIGGNLNIVQTTLGTTILWTETVEGWNELYAVRYEDGSWTEPVVISDNGELLTKISTVCYDGRITGICNANAVAYDEASGEYVKGETDLTLFQANEFSDIALGNSFALNENKLEIGTDTELNVTVYNHGTTSVNEITFTVTDTLGTESAQTMAVDIPSGGYDFVTLTYTVPEEYASATLTICAEIDEADVNDSDNVVTMDIGNHDLAVTETSVEMLNGGYVLRAIVENGSLVDAENVALSICADEEASDVLQSVVIGSIARENFAPAEILITEETLCFDENGTAKVYLKLSSDGGESAGSDNQICVIVTQAIDTICMHPVTYLVDPLAPTCTDAGHEAYEVCMACGEIAGEYTELLALGHSFGDWVTVQEPTITEEGQEARFCDRCGHEEQRVIAKLENPFTDVPEGSFYYDPVMWAIENGITNGTTPTTFNPNGTCLRAHVVTFLYRAAKSPEPSSTKNPFTDVKAEDFYYKPVLWAVEKGITNGISANKFGSMDVCNRAAVVTFLWRAAGSPEPESTNNPFKDVKDTDFFYKPVLWAVENGITNGVNATHFGPATDCNRAQVVTFLYRAYN